MARPGDQLVKGSGEFMQAARVNSGQLPRRRKSASLAASLRADRRSRFSISVNIASSPGARLIATSSAAFRGMPSGRVLLLADPDARHARRKPKTFIVLRHNLPLSG